jgi:hypothetical protein
MGISIKLGERGAVKLVLNMMELIHRTGRVVRGDSSFCMVVAMNVLHVHGVYDQFLIKKGVSGQRVSQVA